MIILAVILTFVSGFFFIWAFNLSFAAHLKEESKDMWTLHAYSYAATIAGLASLVAAIGVTI